MFCGLTIFNSWVNLHFKQMISVVFHRPKNSQNQNPDTQHLLLSFWFTTWWFFCVLYIFRYHCGTCSCNWFRHWNKCKNSVSHRKYIARFSRYGSQQNGAEILIWTDNASNVWDFLLFTFCMNSIHKIFTKEMLNMHGLAFARQFCSM